MKLAITALAAGLVLASAGTLSAHEKAADVRLSPKDAEASRLRLTPLAGRRGAGFGAVLQF